MSDRPSRQDAWTLLTEFTDNPSLIKHALAVEAAMRAYARRFGENEEDWATIGLIHDFDYQQNPTVETHLHVGTAILRERGWPEDWVRTVASHADYMGVPRDTPMKKALYGCDELVGFIGAAVKVRPTKKVADLPVESVTRKLKDKAFARSVDRACVYGGAEALGRPLAEHVAFVIAALAPIADEIGL